MSTENISETVEAIEFSRKSISDLGALFSSILAQSEEGTTAHNLAGIGTYLADDFSAVIESMPTNVQEANSEAV